MSGSGEVGTIYLLHFSEPFKHARHYLGWSRNLEARLEHHEAGSGANLLRHVAAAGITWELVRTWEGDRNEERRLKKHSSTRYCPICHPSALAYDLREPTSA